MQTETEEEFPIEPIEPWQGKVPRSIRREPLKRLMHKKKIPTEATFEMRWDGSKMRPLDEVQYCPICGALTVVQGQKLNHTGEHSKWSSKNSDGKGRTSGNHGDK